MRIKRLFDLFFLTWSIHISNIEVYIYLRIINKLSVSSAYGFSELENMKHSWHFLVGYFFFIWTELEKISFNQEIPQDFDVIRYIWRIFFSGVEVSSIFTPHTFKMLKQIRDRPLTTLTREHDSNLILRSLWTKWVGPLQNSLESSRTLSQAPNKVEMPEGFLKNPVSNRADQNRKLQNFLHLAA